MYKVQNYKFVYCMYVQVNEDNPTINKTPPQIQSGT